jgi:hypothetical protein
VEVTVASRERHALVVGNGSYGDSLGILRNPVRDADSISKMLDRYGYKVTKETNVTKDRFPEILDEFYRVAEGSPVALFYYSGHGLCSDNRNFLVPTDCQIVTQDDLESFINVEDVIGRFSAATGTTIFFFDACRRIVGAAEEAEDAGPDALARKIEIGPGIQVSEGFSSFALPRDSNDLFISFSAAPGQVAYDGDGSNSPFATALLKFMPMRGISLPDLSTRINDFVLKETDRRQRPWPINALTNSRFSIVNKTYWPLLLIFLATLFSGYGSARYASSTVLMLNNINLIPGLLFGFLLLPFLWRYGGKSRVPYLLPLAVLMVWVISYLLFKYWSVTIHDTAQTAIDIASSDAEISDADRSKSIFQRDNSETTAGVLAGMLSAGLLAALLAIFFEQAASLSLFLAATLVGGIAILLGGAFVKFYQVNVSIESAGLFAWQVGMGLVIGLGVCLRVPTQYNSLANFFYRPTFEKKDVYLLACALVSGAFSGWIIDSEIDPKSTFFEVPIGPPLALGIVLVLFSWTRSLGIVGATIAPLSVVFAWILAYNGTQQAIDYVPAVAYPFLFGGFIGAVTLSAILSYCIVQLRNLTSLFILGLTGMVLTIPYIAVGISGVSRGVTLIDPNIVEFGVLFVVWQIGIISMLTYVAKRPADRFMD